MNVGSISFMSSFTNSSSMMGGMGGMRGPSSSDFASDILENLDADGDGSLSIEESTLSEDLFAEIDSDGDGLLSTEELESAHEQHMAERPPMPGGMMGMMPPPMSSSEMAADIIEREDTDGDGVISVDESALSEDMFNEIDSDGDGLLTADEIVASHEARMESMPEPTQSWGMDTESTEQQDPFLALMDALNESQGTSSYEQNQALFALIQASHSADSLLSVSA